MKFIITNHGFPTLTLSKLSDGDILYSEMNAMLASSKVFEKEEDAASSNNGGIVRRLLTQYELKGINDPFAPQEMGNSFSNFVERLICDSKRTINRQRLGEKSYVLYKAVKDGQKISFKACFPGTILAWNAKPLSEGEVYCADGQVKSIFSKDETNRPHGTICMVTGSFLVAQFQVKAEIYRTEDVKVLNFSGTKDRFQKFSGDGYVFCEVHGDLMEIPLYEGESVDVYPGFLLGFTEGVELKMTSAGGVTLRNMENNDYMITCTAGEKGGYVYIHSVNPSDFFHRDDK